MNNLMINLNIIYFGFFFYGFFFGKSLLIGAK